MPNDTGEEVLGTCDQRGHSSVEGTRVHHVRTWYCRNWKPLPDPAAISAPECLQSSQSAEAAKDTQAPAALRPK